MKLFGRGRRAVPRTSPSTPEGIRIYAIGDVHGRLDLLHDILAQIEADDVARGRAETHLVMLGDLIDRGPDSAGVVELFRATPPPFLSEVHLVMGNHEEMLLRLIDEPSPEALTHFLRYGGYQTLESYGTPERMLELPELYPIEALLAFVPPEDSGFLRTFAESVQLGDYLFVHAGIRPDVPLAEQVGSDLRWIRAPFLTSDADHGVTIVHGHTISSKPEMRANRIGIDTGAYASGILTAVGLDRYDQWLLATGTDRAAH